MNVLISFANTNEFKQSQQRLYETKDVGGFDECINYTENDLDETLIRENKKIFDCGWGYGCWMWKPYLILKTFEKLSEGDTVFYCDSKVKFIQNAKEIIEHKDDIVLFGTQYKIKQFTKKDCFVVMFADQMKYTESFMVNAAFQRYRKNQNTINFLNEYLFWCKNYNANSNDINLFGPNYPEFLGHRFDQSILSILSVKHDILLHRDLSQFGNDYNNLYPDTYPQIVTHR